MTRTILFSPMALLVACSSPGAGDDVPDLDDGCPRLFAQSIVPEYHVEMSSAEWAALHDEFVNRVAREDAGLDPHPYHPVTLRYVGGSEQAEVPDVLLRLKGASSWLQTLDLDDNPKMQFVIAFNEIDPKGRFMGVRKVELDMPRTDRTFIKQRLALSYLREAGVPAQCANNARMYINGEYYGLYTHIERLDKEFIQRHWPDADDGDLWKAGREIKTNEDTFDWRRIDDLWHVPDFAAFAELADVEASLYEWAAEAVVGDADGYYNGRANFYLYDHPTRGFLWIPHDIDTAFDDDFLPEDAPPVFPSCAGRWERDWHHYIVAMNDPAAVELYVRALSDARSRYDVGAMQQRVTDWSEQIVTAAAEDPHRPFGMDEHYHAVSEIWTYAAKRADYLDAWLDCRERGGPDADGDGVDMCHDCNDDDPTVRPGAPEVCNLRDDNCDGRVDTVDGISVCE
jgi:hypothetical protein